MTRRFNVTQGIAAQADLNAIFDFLVATHIGFGAAENEAIESAEKRVNAILDSLEGLARAPFQGVLLPELRPTLRRVTKDRAIFYFEVDEATETVRVLAIFFGGRDHIEEMRRRMG